MAIQYDPSEIQDVGIPFSNGSEEAGLVSKPSEGGAYTNESVGEYATALSAANEAVAAKIAAQAAQAAAETAEGNASTSETNASTSETNAASSATASATSATSSATSASAASASATAAATSESNASTSEGNAADSAADASKLAVYAEDSQYTLSDGTTTGYSSLHYNAKAQAAKTAAETAQGLAEDAQSAAESALSSTQSIFQQFGDQYLGSHADDASAEAAVSSPSELGSGDIYWNTTDEVLKFYTGTAWVAPEDIATTAASNALTSENNAATSEATALDAYNDALKLAINPEDSEFTLSDGTTTGYSTLHFHNKVEARVVDAENAADAASASETAAGLSEDAAAISASAAATSASNAAASYDSFDDRYLGAKTSDPESDNDGQALITGALYFDSTNGLMKVFNGTEWISASSSIEGIKTDFIYTATAGQTIFSGADDNTNTLVLDQAGLANVYLNGVRLVDSDYTASVANDSITLTVGASLGDTLEVEVFGNFAGQTGADVAITGGVITGLTNLTTSSLQVLGGDGTQGTLTWNIDEETLDLIQNGATLQVGQETQIHVTLHGSAASIADGEAVVAVGSTGGSGKILVCKASVSQFNLCTGQSVTEIPAKFVIGVATEAITNNGKVTNFGKINDVAGASYTQGSVYYVNESTGGLTATAPTSGLVMPIAFAINADTLMVRTTPINELDVAKGVTAYGWGDHSSAGYELTSNLGTAAYTASTAYATAAQGTLADSALQSFTETDPVFTAWDKSTGISITESQISDFGSYAALAGSASQSFSASTLNATTVDLGNWTVTESSGVLYFATGGVNKMSLDSSGNLKVVGDVEANATL